MSLSVEDESLVMKIRDDIGKDLTGRIRKKMTKERRVFQGLARDFLMYKDGRVETEILWWRVIEYGFPPGLWIPIVRLRDWVKYGGKVAHDGTEKGIDRVTYAMKGHIHKHGIEPTRIVKRTLMEMENA